MNSQQVSLTLEGLSGEELKPGEIQPMPTLLCLGEQYVSGHFPKVLRIWGELLKTRLSAFNLIINTKSGSVLSKGEDRTFSWTKMERISWESQSVSFNKYFLERSLVDGAQSFLRERGQTVDQFEYQSRSRNCQKHRTCLHLPRLLPSPT